MTEQNSKRQPFSDGREAEAAAVADAAAAVGACSRAQALQRTRQPSARTASWLPEPAQAKLEFREKNDWLASLYERVTPQQFYRELFGQAQPERRMTRAECRDPKSQHTGRGNLLVVSAKDVPDGQGGTRRVMHTTLYNAETADHLAADFRDNDCALIAPVEWYGRTCLSSNARYIHAIVIDLDYVGLTELRRLDYQCHNLDDVPLPTFLVNSGTGMHLYYLLDAPLAAYPSARAALLKLKHGLITEIWNRYTSRKCFEMTREGKAVDYRQYQGPCQGYRVIGSRTKTAGCHVTAFRVGDRVTLEDLNACVKDEYKISEADLHYRTDGRTPLEEAKKLWPEWYERRIVKKQPRGGWGCSHKLYDWFRGEIEHQGKAGHRYYCIGMLAVYAVKCGVSAEQLRTDALALVPELDRRGRDTNTGIWDHFTEEDALAAIKAFSKLESRNFKKRTIQFLSAVDIRNTNKRNHRTQPMHLKIARAVRDIVAPNWRNTKGAPEKASTVAAWRQDHPDGKKADCVRDTGLSKPTVYKWWNASQESGKP